MAPSSWLVDALDAEFTKVGSALKATWHQDASPSWAWVRLGRRSATVAGHREDGTCSLEIYEDAECMAGGWATLSGVAAAIRLVLEDDQKRTSDLIKDAPFLKLKRFALSYERGTYIEDNWQYMLSPEWHLSDIPDMTELVQLAAGRPKLRQLLPYTSHDRFSVNPGWPLLDTDPLRIRPIRDGTYALERGEAEITTGSASALLDSLEEWAWNQRRVMSADVGQRVVNALGEQGAHELLGILERPDADRAALIGRMYARNDARWLAELLMDLEDDMGEIARLLLVDALKRELGPQ